MDDLDIDSVGWAQLSHAYGPATEIPGWLRGLRGDEAKNCLSELYGSITHQGTRYSATPACVPFLVEAALDHTVQDRVGVIFLIQFCAMGYLGDRLDWTHQRSLQRADHERRSWRAVVDQHPRLRALLEDADRSVARSALTVLAWTGDDHPDVLQHLARALQSDDDLDVATAWLAAVVLGKKPDAVEAPTELENGHAARRFASAIATLRFAGELAPPEAVEELCSVFESVEAGRDLTECES